MSLLASVFAALLIACQGTTAQDTCSSGCGDEYCCLDSIQCNWCSDSGFEDGICKNITYVPTADWECSIPTSGCASLRTNSSCSADPNCKFCQTFEQGWTFCSNRTEDHSGGALCDESHALLVEEQGACSLYKIDSDTCGESTLDCKYAKYAKLAEKGFKDGTCVSQGYTVLKATSTKKFPIAVTFTEYAKPTSASAQLSSSPTPGLRGKSCTPKKLFQLCNPLNRLQDDCCDSRYVCLGLCMITG